LLETLGPQGSRAQHADTWLALFDLYRATGQQDKFEHQAIEFVGRFDRSAPQWYSMPDMVKQLASPTAPVPGNGPAADWICPSVLGIQTVAALTAALARAPMPWRLDWHNLKSIDAGAVEPLGKVFSSWAAQPVQLRFIGAAQLQHVLQDATPSGVRETAQAWWQLRLEALRVTHQPDEFELTALDFCVTYEVSPPAWDSARCEYKPLDPQGAAVSGQAIIGDVYRDSAPSSISSVMEGDTQMDGHSQMSNLFAVELSGQIQGDAIDVLDKLEAKLMGADIMVISCAKLIRVDFSAAGTLLNWVSARESESRAVQFTDVHRLVAAFFNVIGITEHARVLTRID
ncbi:MAG: STAS domain-containing protein, partial [Polaromonas sp.]|nr:STAS domain-containing protein [Polaromonas sp.]